MRFLTGIGSRETPIEIKSIIFDLAEKFAKSGYTLRSGGADGSDKFWEEAYDKCNGKKEIFLPWKNFNNNLSFLFHIPKDAYRVAQSVHPAWHKLSLGAKKLHARNIMQVLGADLKTPSELVICWTKHGDKTGGTRTAIILAERHEIPVFNLAKSKDIDTILKYAIK